MKGFIQEILRKRLLEVKDEWFKAYHGRYIFNVRKLYELIENKRIPFTIKTYSPFILKQYSHPEFSETNPEKLEKLRNQIDFEKPLGLVVKFQDPESKEIEWILVDGNHRVRIAAESGMQGKLYVIDDIEAVNRVMKVNTQVPHEFLQVDENKK